MRPAELFKALGVETRLKIIDLMKKRGSIGVKEIAAELGITASAASQHMKILKTIGLVNSRREGYFIPYFLDEEAMEHCSTMMNRICSCHHPHQHFHGEMDEDDLKKKSIDELEMLKDSLEKKLTHVNQILEQLRTEG
jgi:DNA-binding transcriptional ArsR family regulator